MTFPRAIISQASQQHHAPDSVLLALLNCLPFGLVAVDANGPVAINDAARNMVGLDPATSAKSMLDWHSAGLLHPDQQRQLTDLVLGSVEGPLPIATNAGAQLTATRYTGVDGCAVVAMMAAESEAAVPRRLDALTGLPDRQTFLERLSALCARSDQAVAVMMIDLDHFKSVNDTLGHPAGDAVLKLVAKRLQGILRKADVVSRLGGDEFAVAMIATPELPEIADRLVSVLTRPYLVELQPAVIGASIGVAYGPQHGATPGRLIRAADIALYQAKADGRGSVRVYDIEMGERSSRRYALADDLRRAIPLQQLEVYFQPQVCLQSRKLNGFEALVRWNHPKWGLVGPDQFIPLAEETGLILSVGEWVLQNACKHAARWPKPVTVAVNVSPLQLLDRDRLPRVIKATLASTNLPAHRLEIEVTESALMREADALAVLTEIRAMGVKVSMDDFGTGYSSLSQLRRFPFDKLKIDRSFVRDLGDSDEARAVVRAIAALGNSLGMATIAEGVETADQEALCRADGCSAMQGYLISRPIPAGSVDALIQTLA